MSFDTAYSRTALFEGGYSDNPKDKGGPTNYGITEAVARANGYTGDMKDLPKDLAKSIAKKQYWDTLRLDVISMSSPPIADELFDTGLNCGIGEAAKMLQRALNVLNRETHDYGDINVDGVIGPMTTMMLYSYLQTRQVGGVGVMLKVLNALQGAYYVDIAEKRQANEEFIFGWFTNRVAI